MKVYQPAKNLSKYELNLLDRIMKTVENESAGYMGNFTAEWLLSDFEEPIWVTRNKGRKKGTSGAISNTIKIDWNKQLPNGKLLTDSSYSNFLFVIKKIAFLMRSGFLDKNYGPTRWKRITIDLKNFACWVVLNEGKYEPEKFNFNLVDQSGLDSLFYRLAAGGWVEALEVPQRILNEIHRRSNGAVPIISFLSGSLFVSEDSAKKIIAWFAAADFYTPSYSGVYGGRLYLDRTKLDKLIFSDCSGLSDRYAAFLRQFEPDFQFSEYLVPIVMRTEYPHQNTPLVRDALEISFCHDGLGSFCGSLKILISASRYFNDNELPDQKNFRPILSFEKSKRFTKPKGHTSLIPFPIGLSYLNTSVKWIHCYGHAIVELFEQWVGSMDGDAYLSMVSSARGKYISSQRDSIDFETLKFVTGSGYEYLKDYINVATYRRATFRKDLVDMREHPTPSEALDILIGSCIVCICMMKPSRCDEIINLSRDCLVQRSDGYYLKFKLGKSGGEENVEAVRPIPYIAAVAVELLGKIGDITRKSASIKYKLLNENLLFNLPSSHVGKPKKNHADSLIKYLNVFCDFVNLPPDGNGLRWYVRVHETRKWFLLLLFWSGRYDVLDAARWIAGHTDATHIYDYIEAEFPGEELPKLEAEYAIERLLKLESNTLPKEQQGLHELYNRVLKNFNVESLMIVPQSEWENFIHDFRREEGFFLEPHSIRAENTNEIVDIDVFFILREIKGD